MNTTPNQTALQHGSRATQGSAARKCCCAPVMRLSVSNVKTTAFLVFQKVLGKTQKIHETKNKVFKKQQMNILNAKKFINASFYKIQHSEVVFTSRNHGVQRLAYPTVCQIH